ncbi:Macrophage migration inhibitory factor [Aphelenchoides fujianensis]|nr:Macrophage migration inhibitory factor [Aphelenchoides fujianensis]
MPMLLITTNVSASAVPADFNAHATKSLAELLQKPPQFVLVSVSPNPLLTLGGTSDPAALVEIRSIGGVRGENAQKVVTSLTDLIHEHLKVEAARVFVHLVDLDPSTVHGWHCGETRSDSLLALLFVYSTIGL